MYKRQLSYSFPKLMKQLPAFLGHEDDSTKATGTASNPFDKGAQNHGQWLVTNTMKKDYDNIFFMLPGSAFEDGGKVQGGDCVNAMTARGGGTVGRDTLFKIWNLCDPNNTGTLDDERFSVAMYLIDGVKAGNPVPNELPEELIPPKMRDWDGGLK